MHTAMKMNFYTKQLAVTFMMTSLAFTLFTPSAQATNEKPTKNLRNSIAIVKAKPDVSIRSTLEDYSLWLSRMDKRSASRKLSKMIRPGFGSGFVVEDSGKLYLITNSHVIGIASVADVTFCMTDTLRLTDCKCVYQNDNADIAILRLPVGAAKDVIPLALHKYAPIEGIDVYTAGFPALGNTPSWQFGKGIVSNAQLHIDGVDYTWIQHTGQIDPGSSGSPLLIKHEGAFEVLGINTLKAHERESVGIASPVSVIQTALQNEGYFEFEHVLQALDTMAIEKYSELYERVPQEIIDTQEEFFKNGEVLKGLAVIPEYAASNPIGRKRLRIAATVSPSSSNTNLSKSKSKSSDKNDQTSANKKNERKNGIDKDLEHKVGLYLNSNYHFTTPGTAFVGLGGHGSIANYMRIAGFMQGVVWGTQSTHRYGVNITLGIGAQLPIAIGEIDLIPYIQPNAGIGMAAKTSDMTIIGNYGGKVGLELCIPTLRRTLLVGADYDLEWFKPILANPYTSGPSHAIGVHIGIAL